MAPSPVVAPALEQVLEEQPMQLDEVAEEIKEEEGKFFACLFVFCELTFSL